jgi:ABC-type Mn2+/Zn2+ transport system permease subunit
LLARLNCRQPAADLRHVAHRLIVLLDGNVLGVIMRPLLFASLQPELAEAKGVSLRLVSMLFLTIAALAVAAWTHIVGVLLVFTLMVGPAAAAQNLSTRLSTGLLHAALAALAYGGSLVVRR